MTFSNDARVYVIASSLFLCFVSFFFLIQINRINKAAKELFSNTDCVEFELINNERSFKLTNLDNNNVYCFDYNEIIRKAFYKNVIVIYINKKGSISFPNTIEIKRLFSNK